MDSLDKLFHAVCAGEITENDFILFLRSSEVPTEWIHRQMKAAYDERDALKIEYLLSCIRLPSFNERGDTQAILHLLYEIMIDPSFAYSAESVADALGYCRLEKDALDYFVKLCTSPIWLKVAWPDLRKALEAIYAIYKEKICSKSEVLEAFQTILTSTNIPAEWRDCTQAYIDEINSVNVPVDLQGQ